MSHISQGFAARLGRCNGMLLSHMPWHVWYLKATAKHEEIAGNHVVVFVTQPTYQSMQYSRRVPAGGMTGVCPAACQQCYITCNIVQLQPTADK